jgi:microcystin-dependent protein
MRIFSFSFAPRGWAFCNGQLLPINQNQALFSILGTMYGGNGQTNFALPDFRGRIPMHVGQGQGLSPYVQGQVGGVENVTLTTAAMPGHVHTAQGFNGQSNLGPTTNNTWANQAANPYKATADASMNPATITPNSGGQPHPNLAPYLVLNFCIAIQGIFPSRN